MSSGSTSNYSFPYPVPTDPVNVSGDIESLASSIDFKLQEIIEDSSSSMWTGGVFSNGIQTPTYNDTTGKMSMSLEQDISSSSSPTFNNLNISGSVISGGWEGDTISASKGGTGISLYSAGDIIYASSSSTLSSLNIASEGGILYSNGASPVWLDSSGSGSVARVSSPQFLGVPTAPTAASGVSTTQIATTEFVYTLLQELGGLPDQSGNAGKYLTTDGSEPSWSDLSSKANVDSPTFTGIPTAPTASVGTNTGQIATTNFVQTAISTIPTETIVEDVISISFFTMGS